MAARVVTAAGVRAFVKAVSTAQNPQSPDVMRREIAVLESMPRGAGVPALLAAYDDGDWVGLLIEDVEGRHPSTPWVDAEVRATFEALHALEAHAAPAQWPALEEELVGELTACSRIAQAPPVELDPWLAGRFRWLDELSRQTLPRLAGGAIAHTDLRADNLLVTTSGRLP